MKTIKPGDSITGEEWEKIHTLAVLERKGGDQKATSKTLNIDRKTLYRRLKRWGLIKGWYAKDPTPAQSPPPVPAPRAPIEMTPEQKLRYDPPTLL